VPEHTGPGKILSDVGISSYMFSRDHSGVRIKVKFGQRPNMQITLEAAKIKDLKDELNRMPFDGLTDLQKNTLISKLSRDPRNKHNI
jgi:hypothetical protein